MRVALPGPEPEARSPATKLPPSIHGCTAICLLPRHLRPEQPPRPDSPGLPATQATTDKQRKQRNLPADLQHQHQQPSPHP